MNREWQTLKVWVDGKVGHVLLNRPQVLNALNYTVVLELEQAVRELETRARVILIEGAGDHFCAGADLRYVAETDKLRELIEQINRAFFAIERAPIPVVAAVHGYALAGGFELMQACDVVIVADNATIGDQHSNFGLIPGGGGSQRLPRLIGRQRALPSGPSEASCRMTNSNVCCASLFSAVKTVSAWLASAPSNSPNSR